MVELGRRVIIAGFAVSILTGLGIALVGNFLYEALIQNSNNGTTNVSTPGLASAAIIGGILLLMEGLHLQYVEWIHQRIHEFENTLKEELENLFG